MPVSISGSGSITGVSSLTQLATLDVTGAVSVGGTLTYEDVTSIDVVGLVTARAGIKVLAGGINAVGVVTASSFSGSLATTDLTGTITNAQLAGSISNDKLAGSIADNKLASTFLKNVIEDTTPQLGGNLDANSKDITGIAKLNTTNIDSVGVVTARSGIDIVGGSKKLNFNSGASGIFQIWRESSGNAYIEATNQFRMYSGDRFSFSKIGGIDFLVLDTTGNIVTGNTNIIGNVGVSSAVPKTDLDVSTKTGAVALPQGTTAQRPSGSAPYIRKNTTNNALEYFDGTSWVEIITDYFPTGSTILG